MPPAHVTQPELVSGLLGLGLKAGDLVFIHASLSRFGHVEGGARTVIEALLEAIGPSGTLAMPAFTFGLLSEPRPVLDIRHSPCWVGKIYELFRTGYATRRSHQLTHSVCAVGPLAEELTREHGPTPFSETSPFVKLARGRGKLVLMGVGHNSNTTMHAVEETEHLEYCLMRENTEARIIDEEGIERPLPSFLHVPVKRYDFNRMNETLVRAGIQREAFIGDARVRCLDAARMFDCAVQAVRRDPEALLQIGEGRLQIPVGRVDGQLVCA